MSLVEVITSEKRRRRCCSRPEKCHGGAHWASWA